MGHAAGASQGPDIPQGARIIAVADSYEAMPADRPYRRALSVRKAVTGLRNNSGSQFDPDVVKAFLEIPEETSGVAWDHL